MASDERHILDDVQNYTLSDHAEDLASEVKYWDPDVVPFPPGSRYLAIGAGFAEGELTFAKCLGIDPENITVVDRNSPPAEMLPSTITTPPVKEDIFAFLKKPLKQKFDLVTAFGMQYFLTDEKLGQLLAALSPHLNPGAHVVICPHFEQAVRHPWFESRPTNDVTNVMQYRFIGI